MAPSRSRFGAYPTTNYEWSVPRMAFTDSFQDDEDDVAIVVVVASSVVIRNL